MSTTAYHYKMIRDLEVMCDRMGFSIRLGDAYDSSDILSIVPKDNNLPIYTREVRLMRGTVEELTSFLIGWLKAKEYFSMLNLVDDQKIFRKEQDYRNKALASMIKGQTVEDKNGPPF